MKVRDAVPLAFALAALVAFALFLYFAEASDSMHAGMAFASAVCLWLGGITFGFTASQPVRKRLLIWSGLVAPLVCAAAYVVLIVL